jgi:hypothetical protein
MLSFFGGQRIDPPESIFAAYYISQNQTLIAPIDLGTHRCATTD